jgi:riboflavin biosynthesis pyrimidine reductase
VEYHPGGSISGTASPDDNVVVADSERRPRVITHNSASVDGRIALSPGVLLMTDTRWPQDAGEAYAKVIARHAPQVLLEGSGSFVPDDQGAADVPDLPDGPTPAALRLDFLPAEALAAATAGWLVVPDSRGRVRWAFKQFPDPAWAGWHLLVLVSDATPTGYLAFLRREGIPYLCVGTSRVDLAAALARLAEVLEVRTVVASGGGRLTGALLRAGLVDEIEVEVLPIAVGGTRTPALFTAPDLPDDADPNALRLLAVDVDVAKGPRVLLRYEVLP